LLSLFFVVISQGLQSHLGDTMYMWFQLDEKALRKSRPSPSTVLLFCWQYGADT